MQTLLRSTLICVLSVLIHSLLHSFPLNEKLKFMESQLFFPILMAMVPYVMTFIPLFGIKDLMKHGMPPIYATLALAISGFVAINIVHQLRETSVDDPLHKFLENKVQIGNLKIVPELIVSSILACFVELLFQHLYINNEKSSQLDVIVKGMEKFYKKHNMKLNN